MSGGLPLLSLVIFLPLVGALLLAPLWRHPAGARGAAMGAAATELLLVLLLASRYSPDGSGVILSENLPWIETFGIRYALSLDGISLLMVLLTALITVIAMAVSWRSVRARVPLHYLVLLVMETGIMGVFLATDLFLFYLFWEVMLIPMFLLIGVWGHGRRIYSAVKFFLYTFAGSLLMLLAIIRVFLLHSDQTGVASFALSDLVRTVVPETTGLVLFAAFFLAFAIKVPLFPFHTWLPDAHTDAPTAGSVILAGLLLKTGAYGLIRFGYPLFPAAAQAFAPLIQALAVVGIVYGSWIAFAQTDMKRLVAYSSVGHMGFVALGIAAWTPVSLSGSILQMVNHGITTGALFALVGMVDERAGTREIDAFGGLWGRAPVLAFFFLLFAMASAGLPGLNNFAGEFLVLAGSFRTAPLAAAFAFSGVVFALIYTVRLVQELLFGGERRGLPVADLSLREGGILLLLAALVVWLGVHPAPVLEILTVPVGGLTGGR